MGDYAERIREITDVRQRSLVECENQRRLIGDRLIALPETEIPESVTALVQRHHEIAERIERSSTALERMITIDDRENEIRSEMKALQKQRDEAGGGLEHVYEQIGAVAYRLFKQHPLIDASYSEVFSDLARYHDDVRQIENELGKYSAEPDTGRRTLFERIGARGKKALLRNRHSIKQNQLPRLLQDAGKRLMDTDFVAQLDDEELNAVATPIREARQRQREIDAGIASLAEESGRLVSEFNALSDGKKLPRARKDREGEIDEARSELNEILAEIGRTVADNPPEALASAVRALRDCEARTAHFDSIIRRLNSGQLAETVAQELEELDAEIDSLAERLSERKKTRTARRKRHAELVEERGDEADLFDR